VYCKRGVSGVHSYSCVTVLHFSPIPRLNPVDYLKLQIGYRLRCLMIVELGRCAKRIINTCGLNLNKTA
jgi:hypothetical protein